MTIASLIKLTSNLHSSYSGNKTHFIAFIVFSLLMGNISTPVYGQGKRTTEEEVNTQKIFIDANREKILGNYEDAAYLYKEVLKRDKNNHAAAYELARIYDVLDKDSKALNSIKLALAIDKENIWYQMFLADVYEKGNEFEKAASVYAVLPEKDPLHAEHYYSKWAFYLIKAQKSIEAIEVYNKLENKIGVTEDITRKKQTLYIGIGKDEEAANEWLKLIKAFPSRIDYRHTLAQYYTSTGKTTKAKEVYQQILAIDPEDPKASIELASSGQEKKVGVAYLNSLKPIFNKADVEIDLKIKELIPYINEVVQSGNQELAQACIQLAQTLEQVHPEEAKAYSAHADLLYHSGQKDLALSKYQKAVELDKSIFPLWEQIMYIQTDKYEMEALLKTTESAIDLFPNKAKAYYFNGLANQELNKHMEAVSMFQQALMMSRKNPTLQSDLFRRMGASYFQLNKYERSNKSFESALKLNPDDFMALNDYSFYLASRGEQLEKAQQMIKRSNELLPNKATLQDTYGWVLYKSKEYSKAKEWTSKAINNGGGDSPQILEHYGDILFQLNDIEGALQNWQLALEKGSKSKLLEKKISDRRLYE